MERLQVAYIVLHQAESVAIPALSAESNPSSFGASAMWIDCRGSAWSGSLATFEIAMAESADPECGGSNAANAEAPFRE